MSAMTDPTQTTGRRAWPMNEDCVTGMDIPDSKWTAEDAAFWTGTKHYQPWKDVAAFFKGSTT